MKKVIVIIALVLVCSCVFASHRLSVTLHPYSFQSFVCDDGETKTKINSKYGIGGGIGYDYSFENNMRAGAEVKADTYFIEGQKNFTDITLLAKAGFDFEINEKTAFYTNFKAGLDIQVKEGKASGVFEFGPEVGFGYKINKAFNVFAGCEVLFGFPGDTEAKYREIRITPAIGAGYTF